MKHSGGTKTGAGATALSSRGKTLVLALCLACCAALLLAGCSRPSSSTSSSQSSETSQSSAAQTQSTPKTFPVTVTDDASRTVTIDAEPQRIISLAPANTEILAALGLMDRIVGVTTYDDYPPSAKTKPKMGDFVSPNMEAIGAAKPDLIIATTGVQGDTMKKLEGLGAKVIAIDPTSIQGLYDDINMLGQATGTSDYAKDRVKTMQSEIDAISKAVASEDRVKTFIEIGQDPLFTAGSGTLIDEMITAAGGANVVEKPGYVAYSLEQLLKDDPEVYLATKGTMSDPAGLAKRPGYKQLSAVKAKHVYVLDDNYVTRPGPRIVLGIQQMAAAMHPDKVSR